MAMTTHKPSRDGKPDVESVAPLARLFLWSDTASGVKKLITGLIVLCVFLFLMDFVIHRHAKVPHEETYGFHAIAGFVSFTFIVIGARLLRTVIRRDESFYAPNGVDAESYPMAGTDRLSHGQGATGSLSTLRDEMLGRDSGARS